MAYVSSPVSRPFKQIIVLVIASLLIGAGLLLSLRGINAAALDPRSIQLDNSAVSATNVTYRLDFSVATPGTLGSLEVQFCSNTSLIDDICDPPAGFDLSSANLVDQSGETGFSIHPLSTVNELILTRTPGAASAGQVAYTLDGVTNPSELGTTFMRIMTYPSDDASGAATDAGGLAFATNKALNLSVEVPPYLTFCLGESIAGFNCATAEGNFIDFGLLTPDRTGAGNTQMLVATNGASGYGIRLGGPTLTSGNNEIPPLSGQTSQQGVSQFGLNARANVVPSVGADVQGPGSGQPTVGYNNPDHYRFGSGEVIATSTQPEDFRKYTVSYIVNVSKDQPSGIYATTMTYICLANF